MFQINALIRQSVIDLADDGPIDIKTYQQLSLNNYERNYLLEFVDNETLCHICKQYLQNITILNNYPPTYEEAIVAKLFPELLQRFIEKTQL